MYFDFFILVIISSTIIFNISCHNFISEKRNEYQFVKRNYDEKTQSITNYFGSVTIPNIIKENEYLSYRDNEGNNILISNFGEEEYECFGSCYCDERKTTASNIISKRGSYLLVSISTIIAYKKANTYFDSKCVKELSKECHQSSIKSSVEKCSKILKKKEISADEQYFEERENDEKRIYFCYGNCVVNSNHHRESTRKQFNHFKCEKMKKEGEVIVYESDLIARSGTPSGNFRKTARNKFSEYFLVDFCRENSKKEFVAVFNRNYNGKLYPQKDKKIGHGCVGRDTRGSKLNNIRCRQIEPEPTTRNWKWHIDKWNSEKEDWDLI